MATFLFDVHNLYTKYNSLSKEDVRVLIQWVKDQPHLPDINEPQAILFLHRWHYQLEEAKTGVDIYFTVKTYCTDMFLNRNPMNSWFKDCYDIFFCSILPQKSQKGYSVFFIKSITEDLNRFCSENLIRYFDVILSLDVYEKGPSKGYIIVFDVKNFGLGSVAKWSMNMITSRTFFYYIQKVSVAKFKQFHMINHVPYMNQVVALVKPFMEKEFADEFYVHQSLTDLYEHVPQNYLPKDYGGSEDSVVDLHVKMEKKIMENAALFDWEDGQIVDENKRHNKSTDVIDYLERGSIRNGKFEID